MTNENSNNVPTNELIIQCEQPDQIVRSIDALMPKLSREVRRTLNYIKMRMLSELGEEEMFDRLNSRTVRSVLLEFADEDTKPIDSGQVDDVSYELFEAPRHKGDNNVV